MDFSYLLARYTFPQALLSQEGFQENEGIYSLKKTFSDSNFYGIIRIGDSLFDIKVYETSFDEEYIPFTLKTTQSPLVAGLKEQVNEWVNALIEKAEESNDMVKQTMAYCEQKSGLSPDHPFDEGSHPTSSVYRIAKAGKWFALFMRIKPASLGLEGEKTLEVVNLKEDPETMDKIVDHVHVFPAYHMNRKYWITLVLDSTLPLETMKALIDGSYHEVKAKK